MVQASRILRIRIALTSLTRFGLTSLTMLGLTSLTMLGLFVGCHRQQDSSQAASRPVDTNEAVAGTPTGASKRHLERILSDHLPNPVWIHDRVISGGLPEGDEAFQELARIGVRTIISVDGMTPDVASANKFGLRYVHLPHGYDGIPQGRAQELAKAVLELDGPIYIHCHHGKHRSPAAASVACVTAGLIAPGQAVAILEFAGTSSGYKGLYRSAEAASAMDVALLKKLEVEFKEVQEIPPMAEAMVHLSHAKEHLQKIANAGWRSPPDHPDLDPAHEALLLRELYTELLRAGADHQANANAASQPDFRAWLMHSESLAKELEAELVRWRDSPSTGDPPKRFQLLLNQIAADCKSCHVKYRDIPLAE